MLTDEQIEKVRIDRLHALTMNTNPEWLKFQRAQQAKYQEAVALTKPKGGQTCEPHRFS